MVSPGGMDMKKNVVGIIAEYNPLHNGHTYHLTTARDMSAADAVVVALSSHFVQRGEPAFLDKWQRTRMALSCGADLVLELPCLFSCANAGIFANAGVDILARTGLVTHLSFGMENPCSELDTIAAILVQEPPLFKEKLRFFLDAGYSFVEARSRAVEALLPQGKGFLGGANNSLAVAYSCRVLSGQYGLVLVPVLRKGKGYHDPTPDALASATALREMARRDDREALRRAMPHPPRPFCCSPWTRDGPPRTAPLSGAFSGPSFSGAEREESLPQRNYGKDWSTESSTRHNTARPGRSW